MTQDVRLLDWLPNRLLVAEEGYMAVVSIDLVVEPTVDDHVIFGAAFLKTVIANLRSGCQLGA